MGDEAASALVRAIMGERASERQRRRRVLRARGVGTGSVTVSMGPARAVTVMGSVTGAVWRLPRRHGATGDTSATLPPGEDAAVATNMTAATSV
mmetsp:Transcript_33711/g.78889  ORF Transcript_33711/g.78889 Transcript_33711/m.78889 type:complete len:94 (-) Transcript_33711:289-570(-)